MTQIIKAIPTEYNGEKFKSRLEARWAVFFDLIGIEAHYEMSTFKTEDNISYTPDFEVVWGMVKNENNARPVLEIKPTQPNKSYLDKLMYIRDPQKSDIFIFVGEPSFFQPLGYWIQTQYVYQDHIFIKKVNVITEGFFLIQCPKCGIYEPHPISMLEYCNEVSINCLCYHFEKPKDWKRASIDCKHFRFDL